MLHNGEPPISRLPAGPPNLGKLICIAANMLIEVEVTAGENSPLDLHRMFDLVSEPRAVSAVFTADASGRDGWCRVTGWSDSGQCPARAVIAEDSGEGVVLLVYGGSQGIRLKPDDSPEPWDLANANQWGEACLLLDKDAPFRE